MVVMMGGGCGGGGGGGGGGYGMGGMGGMGGYDRKRKRQSLKGRENSAPINSTTIFFLQRREGKVTKFSLIKITLFLMIFPDRYVSFTFMAKIAPSSFHPVYVSNDN